MLPSAHRLRTGEDFRATVRGGRKAGSRTLVVHLDSPDSGGSPSDREPAGAPRVGLVVSRAVGKAVARNRVKRRLRHLTRGWLAALPAGSVLVVRALPAAAGASSADLGDDLARALGRVLDRSGLTRCGLGGGSTA